MFPRAVGVPAVVQEDPVGAPTPRGNVGNETTPDVTRFFKRLCSETDGMYALHRRIFRKAAPSDPRLKRSRVSSGAGLELFWPSIAKSFFTNLGERGARSDGQWV